MNVSKSVLLLAAVATASAASAETHNLISHDDDTAPLVTRSNGDVTVLSESLEPLRDHFNANKGKHRLIAILSPT